MPGITPPNFTQIPNEILDRMGEMTPAEFKVLMAICRKTFGWHKESDVISLTQLEEMTQLSRTAVQDGIVAAMRRGLLERTPSGKQQFSYQLVMATDDDTPKTPDPPRDPDPEASDDWSSEDTSSHRLPDPVASDGQQLVASGYTQKIPLNKLKETDPDRSDAHARTETDDGSGRSVFLRLRTMGFGETQATAVAKVGLLLDDVGRLAAWIDSHQHGEDGIRNPWAVAYPKLLRGILPFESGCDAAEIAADTRLRTGRRPAAPAPAVVPAPPSAPSVRPPVPPEPEQYVGFREMNRILKEGRLRGMPDHARPEQRYQTAGPGR